jgi:hypothetical protein
MSRSSREGGVRKPVVRALGSSFCFQRNLNPGERIDLLEIFASFLTHDERWASAPLVIQSVGPRLWAMATPIEASAQQPRIAIPARILLIFDVPFPTYDV